MSETHHGHCLCNKVTFAVTGELVQPIACHCTQCRQWAGHYWASTYCDRGKFRIQNRRGFRDMVRLVSICPARLLSFLRFIAFL